MRIFVCFFASITLLFFVACKKNSRYNVSINQSSSAIQPTLRKIVSKGIVGLDDFGFSSIATDADLKKLAYSEHPVLRLTALREILGRKSFNSKRILLTHLDDTAIVPIMAGEFGVWYRTVSDDLLLESQRKQVDKEVLDKTIKEHNYLWAAYVFVQEMEPEEKYYSIVKDMATRQTKSVSFYDPNFFADEDLALFGLAKFKKTEDIPLIKGLLLSRTWKLNELTFRLMKEFPDDSYLDVLEKYYKTNFYRNIRIAKHLNDALGFLRCLATYNNKRSAEILDSMRNNSKGLAHLNQRSITYLQEEVDKAILENKSAHKQPN